MKTLLKFLSENSEFVLTIVTLALVIITFIYLRETRLMRKIADKTFKTETAPKVFLENIKSFPQLNEKKREIEVTAVFKIKNVGKTEAKNFVGDYSLSSGKGKIEGKIGPVTYLFPTQGYQYETKMLGVSLNKQNFAIAKEALEKKKPLIVPEDFGTPIYLDLNLKYIDHEGKEQNLPYKLKYIFHANAWIFIVEENVLGKK